MDLRLACESRENSQELEGTERELVSVIPSLYRGGQQIVDTTGCGKAASIRWELAY
jgi:hypothetical protein